MIEINGKRLCENCFDEISGAFCERCGHDPAAMKRDLIALPPGAVLVGRYIVGKVIGMGGFGITYLAYDAVEGKKAAVKEFFPNGVVARATGTATVSVAADDKEDVFRTGAEKFYNEAQLISKFNGNPNIVSVYGFFYENGTAYFSMEYLKGHTLKEHIKRYGVLTPSQALYIADGVSNALMAAHGSSVLHRDISPDNIIICDNGDVKLIDFGAARQVVTERSQTFSVILKPGYAPLEQYQKKGVQGPWTDIYSLGATLYYTLTKNVPDDPMSRMSSDEEYRSNKHKIHPELWSVISRSTELKAENRYGDIFQLRSDLARISFKPEPLAVPKIPEPAQELPETQPVRPAAEPRAAIYDMPTRYSGDAPVDTAAPAKSGKKRTAVIAAICGGAAVIAAAIMIPTLLSDIKDDISAPNATASDNGSGGGNITESSAENISESSAENIAEDIIENVTDKEYVAADGTTVVYTGESRNGMPDGQGTAAYDGFGVYVGEWENGVRSGQGTMTYDDGDVYEGEWSSDQCCGQGKYIWVNGDVYEGEWKESFMDGYGVYTWKGGNVYEGELEKDYLCGYGTLTYANGDVYAGEWNHSLRDGQGTMTYANGDVYEGEWVAGLQHGQGTMNYADGSVYKGEWRNGVRSGQGTLYAPNGDIIRSGTWKSDKYIE